MIRDVLRSYLSDNVPSVNGRIFDPGGAVESQDKPYLIVQLGVGTNIPAWDGYDGDLSIFINGEENLFVNVDRVEKEVKDALSNVILYDLETKRYYGFEYDRTPAPDRQDDAELRVYTRELAFRMYDYGWKDAVTYDPDPADLLSRLTNAMFPEAGVQPSRWVISDERPGVYYRIAREVSRSGLENWGGAWIDAVVEGRVLSASPVVRDAWVNRISTFLSTYADLIPINDQDNAQLVSVETNLRANPARQGQLRVTVRFPVEHMAIPAQPTPVATRKIDEIDITYDGLVDVVGQRTP